MKWPSSVREVDIAAGTGHRQLLLVGQVDELLQLDGAAVQPIQLGDHHGVDLPGADVGEQIRCSGAGSSPLVARAVVVLVDHRGGPALALAQLCGGLALPGDAVRVVLGLPQVGGGTLWV